MAAGTNIVSRIVALGDDADGFMEVVTGDLPAASPLDYTTRLRTADGCTFQQDDTAAPTSGHAYEITGQAVTQHFEGAGSRAFTLLIFGKGR